MPKAILSVHDKTGLVEFARGLQIARLDADRLRRDRQAAARKQNPRHRSGRLHRLAGNPRRAGEDAASGHARRAAGALHRSRPGRTEETRLGLHRPGGGESVSLRGDHRQAGRHPGRSDREHRHRRRDADPRGGQESPAGDAVLRSGRLSGGAGGTARRRDERGDAQTAGGQRVRARPPRTTPRSRPISAERMRRFGSSPIRSRNCATGKTRTNPPRCIPTNPAPDRWAERCCRARNFPTPTCWIWTCAWRAVTSFQRPTVVIVKQVSPCGIASADALAEAFRGALASDPVSAYRRGGRGQPGRRRGDRQSHRGPVHRMHRRSGIRHPGRASCSPNARIAACWKCRMPSSSRNSNSAR